jgi:hypothetical protein
MMRVAVLMIMILMIGVGLIMRVIVVLCGGVVMRVFMTGVGVAMVKGVQMVVIVLAGMLVRMTVRCRSFGREHIYFCARNAAPHDLARLKPRAHIQSFRRLLQEFQRHTGIHHGAQKHVAADAGKTI